MWDAPLYSLAVLLPAIYMVGIVWNYLAVNANFIYSRLNNYFDMKALIIAREKEQAMLDRLLTEPTSQLLTVYSLLFLLTTRTTGRL